MNEAWNQKRVLIVGMARSGISAAKLLASIGAHVVLSDIRQDINGLEELIRLGCEPRLGEPSENLVSDCDAVIVSPGVLPDAPVIHAAEKRSVPVLSELDMAARYVQGVQIGITGTNGKTTTCSLTGDMLRNAGKQTNVAGNIGLPLSEIALETTPDHYTVIEVSSFQLERMDSFHPHIAAILNLTPDHLNRHKTMEAYGVLKESMLRNQTESDLFVYNLDDPFCEAVASRAKARTVAFSRKKTLKRGAWIQNDQLMIRDRALCSTSELSLPGNHNIENALAAAAIASELSIPAPVIRHTLRSFAGVEHRMEMVRTLDGIRYINDSKGTNPESAMHAVESMSVPTVLIAGGEDKGTDFYAFAHAIQKNKNISHVVLIGKTAESLRQSLAKEGYTACTVVGFDFHKAIDYARTQAMDGGAVLLSPACASFDMFKDFEERGRRFKEIVLSLR